MTILHYIPSLSATDGGTATYMQQLALALGQLVDLHIVTHRSAQELAVRHACVHYLPASSWRLPLIRREFLRVLAEVRPDVVHVNCCWRPVFALVVTWAKRAGYKVVLTPHGMLEPWIVRRHYWSRKVPSLLLWQRRALRDADLIHATAPTEADHIRQIASYCPLLQSWRPSLCTVANGIDVDAIAMRTSWQRRHTLLFLSRIHPKKGLDLLFRAVASLVRSDGTSPALLIRIAGEGQASYLEALKGLCRELGIDDRVEWLGPVYGEQKWQLMQQADLFVLPTHSENFGLVVAESLASGTPVLTTTGTPWLALNERRCGWCVPATVDDLRQALLDFLTLDEKALEQMGRNGRRLVEEQYGVHQVAEAFVKMYRGLLS